MNIDISKAWRPFEPSREAVEAAKERKRLDAEEQDRILAQALRNGMPPSGRWA